MNNFERIKNMTVEEMAEEFYIHLGKCSACPMYFKCKEHHIGKHKCTKAYKQWLLEECEE